MMKASMKKMIGFAIAIMAAVPATSVNAQGLLNLPSVPNSVMTSRGGPQNQNGTKSSEKVVSMRSNSNQFVIHVTPGINQLLPIAVGHINRIVTPFETPFVNTVSDATIEAHENVLYIATQSETPVTLFVTPDVGDESMAISLTLAPKKIPPIEATLKLDKVAEKSFKFSRKKAKRWETEQPYISTIKRTFKEIALGRLPNGYSIGPVEKDSLLPTCIQEGFQFDFLNGQYLRGHSFAVAIGKVTNNSDSEREIDETQCIDGHIVASTSWPHTIFQPGEESEMIVIMRTDVFEPATYTERPSLLER
jgi:conjugal transfer pilus assembly protein TraK